jgi:hypothetical protein
MNWSTGRIEFEVCTLDSELDSVASGEGERGEEGEDEEEEETEIGEEGIGSTNWKLVEGEKEDEDEVEGKDGL